MSLFFGLDPVSLVLGVLVFLFFWNISQSSGKAGLINKLPGPRALPLLGNIFIALEPREVLLEKIKQRNKEFGSIFRVWAGTRPMVIFNKPEYFEILLRSSKHSEKGSSYGFLQPWLGTGLLTSKGKKWALHRKLITPTFHFKVLQGFVDVFHEKAKVLVNKLNAAAETGEEFDIYGFVTLCTLDIICETAMGIKIDAQSENNNQYVRSVFRLSALIVDRINRIWLHPDFLFKLSGTGREFQRELKAVKDFTNKVIQSRKQALKEKKESEEASDGERKKKLTFLDLLLEPSAEGEPVLSDEEISEEVETFMFEGHDTTASAISWALACLGRHPEIQEDCYREIKAIFQDDPDRTPTLADLAEMKLLERVIKETLRLYPSVVTITRVLDEDVKFGDYLVPKGTDAVIMIYGLHRNPELYPNPDKFDPDRFLPENFAKRHPYSYIPFSAGPRNCIGQKFALFEEKVVLSALILKYRFEAFENTDDTTTDPNLVLRPKYGIRMKISKR